MENTSYENILERITPMNIGDLILS